MRPTIKKFLATLILAATAAQPTLGQGVDVITLSCEGKITTGNGSEPISNMGLVVNIPRRSVEGIAEVVAHIDRVDGASIDFSGIAPVTYPGVQGSLGNVTLLGELDRVTGSVSATVTMAGGGGSSMNYDLMCKPTRRLF